MPTMKNPTIYLDTRGLSEGRLTFTDVVIAGIAPGGGLFVPESLPEFTLPEIQVMAEWPYWRRAAAVFTQFGVDLSSDRVDALTKQAYGSNFDDSRIAPVEPVGDMHVLELWHGPTSAFKDMALQAMPLFFSEAITVKRTRGELDSDFLVLVATSGDTGKAALEGFADREHTAIVVFYPAEGVSDIQRKQMVTQHGNNVSVFGVRGNFDDCQSAVKEAFADAEFGRELHDRFALRLSSANSINWGRLLPQVVYYASAYADMAGAGAVQPGLPIDVCVPTGNFGNTLGAYYAKRMGVPIGRLIVASNENNVLTDFIETGVYDIAQRGFITTPSPSMDILISSNLERFLYELTGDAEKVREWMGSLARTGRFQVDDETLRKIHELLVGGFVSNEDSLRTIAHVWNEERYLLDPHTAVAWKVAEQARGDRPMLVVSTAHWAKFGTDVFKALRGIEYSQPMPDDAEEFSGVELLHHVAAMAPGAAPIPSGLAALEGMKERFTGVVNAGREGVETAVLGWLER
ncbi:MAG: threonine synthase [Coriobacteriales bacterium]|nr:threonine synthase [Coriobacteriales bacterium]